MHASVMFWVGSVVSTYDLWDRQTLEVGSLNVNGSVSRYFTGPYVGVDMQEGEGVDIVANAHQLPFGDGDFEVVVCTEMLEHDDRFWLSLAEMGRVLRPGGYLILTTRSNFFPEHSYPDDYYRFSLSSADTLLDLAGCDALDRQPDPGAPGIFALGRHRQ